MINWILQKNLTKPEILQEIKNALSGNDEMWEEIEVIPFSKELPPLKNPNFTNIIYGSTTLMINAYHNKDYQSTLFFDVEKFHMKHYVQQWGKDVLNHHGQMIKFGKLPKFESDDLREWFVRPNRDGKEFDGRLDTFERLKSWSQKVCALNLPELNSETEIWISPPQNIKKEWRLFIVDDNIISTSRYIFKGVLSESAEDIPKTMIGFANQRIQEYRIADVYVMDIADVEDGFKIIECNCFNGTGFYKHDIGKIIKAVNAFLRKNK